MMHDRHGHALSDYALRIGWSDEGWMPVPCLDDHPATEEDWAEARSFDHFFEFATRTEARLAQAQKMTHSTEESGE